MTTFAKVDLTEGQDETGSGAFDGAAMAKDSLTNLALIKYLAIDLAPIGFNMHAYLKEGAGFAIVRDGEGVAIFGIAPTGDDHE